MKFRSILAFPAAALLAACMAMSPIVEAKPVRLSQAQISDIQAKISYDLFDPAAAQFRNIRAADVVLSDGSSERRVCGEVNGKNRLGAYVGFSMFGGRMINGRFVRDDFFGPCEPW